MSNFKKVHTITTNSLPLMLHTKSKKFLSYRSEHCMLSKCYLQRALGYIMCYLVVNNQRSALDLANFKMRLNAKPFQIRLSAKSFEIIKFTLLNAKTE